MFYRDKLKKNIARLTMDGAASGISNSLVAAIIDY